MSVWGNYLTTGQRSGWWVNYREHREMWLRPFRGENLFQEELGGCIPMSGPHIPRTAFGRALGDRGTRIWIAFSGSIPDLVFNTASLLIGQRLQFGSQWKGFFLTLGSLQQMKSSVYPWIGALDRSGDFGDISWELTTDTPYSMRRVGMGIATAYSLVPFLALLV